MDCRSWGPICDCNKKPHCLNLLQIHEYAWLEVWNMLESCKKSQTTWVGGHSSLQFRFPSMCSTKAHCKQHSSPQHSLLERVSGMLCGNMRAIPQQFLTSHSTHMQISNLQTNKKNQPNKQRGRKQKTREPNKLHKSKQLC